MSDFGTFISVTKEDNTSFSEQDITLITETIDTSINTDEFVNALGDPFLFEIAEENDDENPSILIILSENYYGGNPIEDEELFDFVKDSEISQAEEISNILKNILPDYNFTASFEEW